MENNILLYTDENGKTDISVRFAEEDVWVAMEVAKRNKQEKNPLEEFSGVLNNEDAAVMMSAIDDCRKVDQNEW